MEFKLGQQLVEGESISIKIVDTEIAHKDPTSPLDKPP